ncbi:MAG: asparagine synthase (glutamine-hydrolyzing) [Candidatus Taylorbacteria bacterium]|nr:asparagine synthase (glutamine-hydrolyzing) [Candidatus Taylorbacteria bacterium]
MCGIIAITGKDSNKISDGAIKSMLAALSRRGPDDHDFVRLNSETSSSNCVLGQTRLSIVDLSGGHQPMKDNRNPYTIVFNGEIYGYKDLRKELESRGHKFSTNSDTEVVLKAYSEFGRECLKHLDGMFAFALWDERKNELFIARDRFGKKPFYYTFQDGMFTAASEIKALFASGLIKGKIDPQAIDDFLRLLYIPPNKSVYSNIKVLLPAHAAIIKKGKIETWRYWNLEKTEIKTTYAEAKAEIKRLFEKSCEKRMIADVEIGSLLSGGVDSTLVTAYAAKYSDKPIKTFSVKYGDLINELLFAKQASEKIGTDHYSLNADATDLTELKNVVAYFDEPHADSSDFPQHLVSKLAASKVKVALSGDGADELFMGYGWYQKYWHTPRYKLDRIFGNPFSTYKKVTEVFSRSERRRLLKTGQPVSIGPDEFENEILTGYSDDFDKINRCDLLIYLPGQLLTKVDRTSMMHSLEMRTPFLDTALAEFVYNLPTELKLIRNENKSILKEILGEIMPAEFVNRRKQGFGAPIKEWLQEETITNELDRLIRTENHPMYRYLNREQVKKIIEAKSDLNKSSVQKIWSLLCLGIWFELNQKNFE